MVEIRASKRSVNICDVYAGHQHLHLRDEEQAGAGIAATEKGTEQRRLHFLHRMARRASWYPGAVRTGVCTVSYTAKDPVELMTARSFLEG